MSSLTQSSVATLGHSPPRQALEQKCRLHSFTFAVGKAVEISSDAVWIVLFFLLSVCFISGHSGRLPPTMPG